MANSYMHIHQTDILRQKHLEYNI